MWVTPKLRTAAAKSTGVVRRARNDSSSWSWPSSCRSSLSSTAFVHADPAAASASSGDMRVSGAMLAPPAVRLKCTHSPLERSTTPKNAPDSPTGHVSGVGRRPVRSLISSMRSSGSRPGRSHLLMTVMIGMRRWRHTSNSFMVWVSRPRDASTSMIAASTAERTR